MPRGKPDLDAFLAGGLIAEPAVKPAPTLAPALAQADEIEADPAPEPKALAPKVTKVSAKKAPLRTVSVSVRIAAPAAEIVDLYAAVSGHTAHALYRDATTRLAQDLALDKGWQRNLSNDDRAAVRRALRLLDNN